MKTRKTLSLFLVLAMLMSLLTVSAVATNPTTLTGFASPVGSITISGVDVAAAPAPVVTSASFAGYTNYTYTYNIVLAAGTTANPTVTFTKAGGANARIIQLPPAAPQHQVGGAQDVLTYTPSLNNGVASFYTIAHHDVQNSYGRADTYYFNFSVASIESSVVAGGVTLSFGDPAYPSTAPECYMSFTGSGTSYSAVYMGPAVGYYPDMLTMSIVGSNVATVAAAGGAKIVTYSPTGAKTEHDSITPSDNINNGVASSLYTIKIGATSGSSITVKNASGGTLATVSFAAPQSSASTAATGNPAAVNGYLPIGQYANGTSWGNVNGKFTNGIESTGVSLGMLGGYVQFDMGEGKVIENDPTNPYGIDFIVYGNAFVGNPEAGSVMVSVDGKDWYNLAGSRHYMDGTEWDLDVSYLKIDEATTIGGRAFTVGMYYATDFDYDATDVDAAIAAATWTNEFNFGATAWWPAESYYDSVWNDGTVDSRVAGATGDVFRYKNSTGKVEVITYCGVTRVEDDMVILNDTSNQNQPAMTNCYQWGYADVRENGGNYGTAINPYASNASVVAGGDGFDLSWAVDGEGNPVALSGVRYVRVYSSVYYYAGTFGETSTEVCGLYVANGNGGGAASAAPTVKFGRQTSSMETVTTSNMGTASVSFNRGNTCYINVTSSADYIYVNGLQVDSGDNVAFTVENGSTKSVQIITQNGTEAPYVTVVNISR